MSDEQRREPRWRDYETFEDAARRLIGVMDERAKKRKTLAGGDLGPAEIADQVMSPPDKRADGERLRGSVSLDRRPQLTSDQGEVVRGSGMGGGQTDFNFVRFSLMSMEAACPARGDFHAAERARHAPEDEVE
jgi:hypothetical protein